MPATRDARSTPTAHVRPSSSYLTSGRPVALAHRGYAPDGGENSMAAFDAAVALGCEYVETDVHTTTDGVVVAFHDESLERVTDSAGLVDDLPWEVVRTARITGGHPIPTLEDLLQRHPTLRVNIDLKSDAAVEPTVAVIERLHAHDRVLVTSFDDTRRRRALALLSRPVATSAGERCTALMWAASRVLVLAAGVGVLTAEWRHGRVARPGRRVASGMETLGHRLIRAVSRGVDAYQVPEHFRGLRVVDEAFLDAAHLAGAHVHVWTINEVADMERLLDLGVDGLVTDRADRLVELLRTRGELPAA
ncbi:glycerophosphodiester phosphodiesterase family protein [Kytococcus sedentarius]|uniref:glycerophosphodiester phosphodiesterase family protein n=1 Tax=Kytococcus sedentarius TaxID=1276 RepID=UPI0035BBDCF8